METCCDSDGSDVELEGSEQILILEEIEGNMLEDPLDREQEWELLRGYEEVDEEYVGFQSGSQLDFAPDIKKKFTPTLGAKVPISEEARPLSNSFTEEVWGMAIGDILDMQPTVDMRRRRATSHHPNQSWR